MPAVAAHYMFGQEVLRLLPLSIRDFIEEYKPAFDLGLQGPDLLFYYKVWKKNEVVDMGHELHRQKAGDFISKALENIRHSRKQHEAEAYLLGFACHFVLDSTFHGRISELAPEEREHRLLEAELDRQVMGNLSSSRHELLRIDRRNLGWLKLLYPEQSVRILKGCAAGFLHLTAVLDSRNPAVKMAIRLAENVLGKEGSFSSMTLMEEANMKYFNPAREMLEGMGSAAEAGAEAVKNVYSCLKEGCDLRESFQKNFL